ncbi:MAG: hypothetical protein GY869_00645, partial [Planctomycetes bacterium]|nr:hypothetical protein [Planctomycetota bacterium]
MFQTTRAYDNAKKAGNKPLFWAYLSGKRAKRVFGKQTPSENEAGTSGIETWNGDYLTGDNGFFDGGSTPVIAREARVLNFGGISETLTPQRNDLVASLNQA